MDKLQLRAWLLLLHALLFSSLAFGEQRAISEKDLFQFHWVSDPQLTRDGAEVAYVSVAADEKQA
ncbi:MAG: hypothetical protein HY255_08585, partial [Betaproteobacteria bacterium]|nr:hypothetical protein [Betaproteobacteria bacterium]